jgi:hypothetical protein
MGGGSTRSEVNRLSDLRRNGTYKAVIGGFARANLLIQLFQGAFVPLRVISTGMEQPGFLT